MNHSHSKQPTAAMLIIGIALIAANLRAPLTSVGPLIGLIRDSLHISNTLAGMITTLPLFAFALFSPFAPGLARRFGTERVVFAAVITLTLGILLRSFPGSLLLFLGTAIIGLSISVGNVLLPSLIKQQFPKKIGVVTGIYSVSMNTFGALASGISIPLAVELGASWSGALRIWAGLSFIALMLWIPQLRKTRPEINTDQRSKYSNANINIWKSPLAWQVTFYMGLQSMVFYCMVAWMPDILAQGGMDAGMAGWMLSLMQLALIPMTFVGSVLAGRRTDQRSLVALGAICTIGGLSGLLLFSQSIFVFLFIIISGIGIGFSFSLSMMFFSLRTENADEAARLSGMAQSVGYLLAAFGPMLFGYLHDTTNTWSVPMIILIGMAVMCWLADTAS